MKLTTETNINSTQSVDAQQQDSNQTQDLTQQQNINRDQQNGMTLGDCTTPLPSSNQNHPILKSNHPETHHQSPTFHYRNKIVTEKTIYIAPPYSKLQIENSTDQFIAT